MSRTSKIIASVLIGGAGLIFFLNNLYNLETAHALVALILSGGDQPFYKVMGPTVTAAWLSWTGLWVIMAGELGVGILGLMGALNMIRARNGTADDFNRAKRLAILAGALGMLVWYGFFIIIGEGYFNMWQSEAGLGSAGGAFRYGTVCAALMFFIALKDE